MKLEKRASGPLLNLASADGHGVALTLAGAVPALVSLLHPAIDAAVRDNCSRALTQMGLTKWEHLPLGTVVQLNGAVIVDGDAGAKDIMLLSKMRLKEDEMDRALILCSHSNRAAAVALGMLCSCGQGANEPKPSQLAQPLYRATLQPLLQQMLCVRRQWCDAADCTPVAVGYQPVGGISPCGEANVTPTAVQAAKAVEHVLQVASSMSAAEEGFLSTVVAAPSTGWEDQSELLESETLADLVFVLQNDEGACARISAHKVGVISPAPASAPAPAP